MLNDPQNVRRFQIKQIFRPSAPIDNASLFAGRLHEISQLVDAVAEVGRHAILYGERGVGKTSLARMLANHLTPQYVFVNVTCDRQDTFTNIWKRVLRQIQIRISSQPGGLTPQKPVTRKQETLEEQLNESELSPDDIRIIFQRQNVKVVIIIDEVDKLENNGVRGLLADTIKTLSDHASPATLILVGVADSVDELVKDHLSISRALQQVQMKRMTKKELGEALQKCLVLIGMSIDEEAEDTIITLSRGLPHYPHLLGQHAAIAASEYSRNRIIDLDVARAIDQSMIDAQQTILSSYIIATRPHRKESTHREVLLACALADTDELGYFTAGNTKLELAEIMNKHYEVAHFARILSDFCSEQRGNILKRSGIPKRYLYRFVDPLMQPYVIMRGMQDQLIGYDKVKRILG